MNQPVIMRGLFRTAIMMIGFTLASVIVCIAQQIPKVQDLCTLLREADRFDGKIVAIKGILRVSSEIGGIYGKGCKQVSIDGSKWPAAVTFEFLSSYRSPPVGSETVVDRESLEGLGRQLDIGYKSGPRECEVVVVGILRSRDEKLFYTDKAGKRKRIGFGHLGVFPAELLVLNVRSFGEIRKIEGVPR